MEKSNAKGTCGGLRKVACERGQPKENRKREENKLICGEGRALLREWREKTGKKESHTTGQLHHTGRKFRPRVFKKRGAP